MPNTKEILLDIEVLIERLQIEFLVLEFVNYYSLVENSDNPSQYFFRS